MHQKEDRANITKQAMVVQLWTKVLTHIFIEYLFNSQLPSVTSINEIKLRIKSSHWVTKNNPLRDKSRELCDLVRFLDLELFYRQSIRFQVSPLFLEFFFGNKTYVFKYHPYWGTSCECPWSCKSTGTVRYFCIFIFYVRKVRCMCIGR